MRHFGLKEEELKKLPGERCEEGGDGMRGEPADQREAEMGGGEIEDGKRGKREPATTALWNAPAQEIAGGDSKMAGFCQLSLNDPFFRWRHYCPK